MMEREQLWWRAGGPAGLIAKISNAVGQAARVICIVIPNPRPTGFTDALERELRRDLSLDCRYLNFSGENQRASLPHLIGERLDVPATEIASLPDFADHPSLADSVVVVDGIDHSELRRWALFLRAMSARSGNALLGPIIIVLLPTGLTKGEGHELCGTAPVISTLGMISRNDSIAYLSPLGMRADSDLLSRVGHSVMIETAAWSRSLLDHAFGWDVSESVRDHF